MSSTVCDVMCGGVQLRAIFMYIIELCYGLCISSAVLQTLLTCYNVRGCYCVVLRGGVQCYVVVGCTLLCRDLQRCAVINNVLYLQ